ncbi:MAG: hypothetical protein B7Y76_15000 [Sphingobacteriia bacterium 35-40-5]|nr:MAG: hypothetical protein B7Y76_15000 [Sphingobacteriia bacterium 35-40-5]
MPKIKLNIPTPCTQNWNNFPQNSTGGFCSQCSKTIIDFTQLSDKELYQALALQNPGKICGRFTQSQLNRDILITNNQSLKLNKILAGLLIIGTTQTAIANESHAQANTTKSPIEIIAENGREAPKNSPQKLATDTTKFIEGKILDEVLNPIAYASVTLKDKKTGVTTNSKGQFKILVPDSYKRKVSIQVSAVGFDPKEFTISKKELPLKNDLTLKLANAFMGEVVIVRSDD